ncbi:hypothetical protein PIB30_068148 [Stylosanthes scabra]|uniref:Uncharacterized protein n=1 Tax=Stylosanthes scabra TaxID=79078 RepID=A0ABU6QND4_9FABA|nr:hypothetical protein [Stylosanthes scabra]
MAHKGSSPLAKGKGKAHGLPTRASPRLDALRSQVAAQNQLGTPVTPAINAPTSSLPIKKCPLNKVAGEGNDKPDFDGAVNAKFGAEVAKKSARNEKITKKSLKAKSRAYAYAPYEPVHMHCHALGVTS